MAEAPPAGQTGSAGSSNTYPQWGFNQAGTVVEATSETRKVNYEEQGYLDWFTSDAAAKSAYAGMQGILGSGNVAPAIPGLQQIGTFFGDLGEASTWVRVGEVVLGLILLAVGIARITHAVPAATTVAKAAGAAALA